jgi:tetratricopeptide (TPR) repeat protein
MLTKEKGLAIVMCGVGLATAYPSLQQGINTLRNFYSSADALDRDIQADEQAIKENPNDPNAFLKRGDAYRSKGLFAQAIQDYNQAINLDPNNFEAFMHRSDAKGKLGDKIGAQADLEIAFKMARTSNIKK